ncbi:hypothetical protein LSAT2_015155, partial [Lamellibrachia satsuma]
DYREYARGSSYKVFARDSSYKVFARGSGNTTLQLREAGRGSGVVTVDIVVVLRNVGHRVRGLSEDPAALDQPQLGRGRCGRGDISTARAHWLRHLVKDSLSHPSSAVPGSDLYFLYSQWLLAHPLGG